MACVLSNAMHYTKVVPKKQVFSGSFATEGTERGIFTTKARRGTKFFFTGFTG